MRTRIFYLLISLFSLSSAYKPVVLFHGILSDTSSMTVIKEQIEAVTYYEIFSLFKNFIISLIFLFKNHPGTEVYIISKWVNWQSLENALTQIDSFFEDFDEIFEKHPEGIHVIGYSQGGLLARCLIQFYEGHNVKKFISLSSPQGGQYGCKQKHLIL